MSVEDVSGGRNTTCRDDPRLAQRSGMSPERQPSHLVTDRFFQLYDVLVDVARKPAPR
jgi:hypothetical protein